MNVEEKQGNEKVSKRNRQDCRSNEKHRKAIQKHSNSPKKLDSKAIRSSLTGNGTAKEQQLKGSQHPIRSYLQAIENDTRSM